MDETRFPPPTPVGHAALARLAASCDVVALEQHAVRLLQEGRAQDGFRLIDRRCRVGPPAPHCLVLRAEALDRMGLRDLAIVDLRQALDLAPDDCLANRRMMLWAEGPDRREAATTLVRQEHDPLIRRQALQILEADGRAELARIDVFERRIAGWVVWEDPGPAVLQITGAKDRSWRLQPATEHPLGGRGSFAAFDVPWEPTDTPHSVSVCVADRRLATMRIPLRRAAARKTAHGFGPLDARGVAVIVPVFADYASTRLCLDSTLASFGPSTPHRLIVVDDASPEPPLSAHLQALAQAGRIELLVNASNLGFVGSVNRALAAVSDRDVVLLNADTVVPRDFVDRLSAVARGAPGIGTVTPLSNNGEFLSFPRPNRSNPLPTPALLTAQDQAAARVNAGRVVDLPSGIGFCLYITRACLDAVGGLSEDYHRGYLEDVDFCLRARAAGFRNVAAASVFVGHAGSRSFASSKRGLVVRNLAVLERRFPDHRAECAAFMAADPLRAARDRIERDIGLSALRPVILVATAGPVSAIACARGRRLLAAGRPAILLDVTGAGDDATVSLRDLAGGMPQSVQFALRSEHPALRRFLGALDGATIEIFDAHRLPASLSGLLADLDCPTDLVLADGDVLPALGQPGLLPTRWPTDARPHRPDVAPVLPPVHRLVAPDPDADALLMRVFPAIVRPSVPPRRREVGPMGAAAPHLGFVPVFCTPRERELIGELADALLARCPDLTLTVLGRVSTESHLAHRDKLFVTGAIEDDDLDHVRAAHGVTALMVPLDRPLFGHPRVEAARRCACPVAIPDWSGADRPRSRADLAIPPATSLADAADRVIQWLGAADVSRAETTPTRRQARC